MTWIKHLDQTLRSNFTFIYVNDCSITRSIAGCLLATGLS